MNARLIRIGNSRGVRLPKTAIEEAGLRDEVELIVRKGSITLRPLSRRREGWAKAAAECHASGDDAPLLGDFPNDFDEAW
jgi:antitoxin MazE